MSLIQKTPSAKKMLVGLRSMGYSFSTALADIVDNSIAAHANKIWIDSEPQDKNTYLYILDNGIGMNRDKLIDALSFGSDSEHDGTDFLDLGRFGLGLNTASLSQCKRFYVITKQQNDINGGYWDVDELENGDEWMLNILSLNEMEWLPGFKKLLELETGTLVIWKKFDKILSTTSKFESSFRSRIAEAKKHCELVFHRFYDEIEIRFNDARIHRRDPFLTSFDNAQHKTEEYLKYGNQKIYYQAHILPHTSSLTNEQKDLIGGVETMRSEQGFYLYRNRRLIIWGNWLHMNSRSEFFKLARIRVDIPTTLDFVWNLDVKKTSAVIPDSLRDQLWAVVEDASKTSTRTYRFKGEKEYSGKVKVWNRTKTREGEIKYEINDSLPLIVYLKDKLGEEDSVLLDSLLKQIVDYLPKNQLNVDINDTDIKLANGEEQDDLNQLVNQLALVLSGLPPIARATICDKYLQYENYVLLKERREEILKKADEYATNR